MKPHQFAISLINSDIIVCAEENANTECVFSLIRATTMTKTAAVALYFHLLIFIIVHAHIQRPHSHIASRTHTHTCTSHNIAHTLCIYIASLARALQFVCAIKQ